MRRRPTRGGRELQASLFAATAPMRTIPAAGYARRVTDRLLELLGAARRWATARSKARRLSRRLRRIVVHPS
jgi:hypothetical protein